MNTDRTPATAVRRAFTLIELMVVIAIIGLLVAVLLPTFEAVRINAKKATVTAQYQAIDQGINLFQNESALGGALPPSASDRRGGSGNFQTIANPKKLKGGNGGNDEVRIAGAHLLVHALVGADQLGPPGFRDLDRDGRWWNDTSDELPNPPNDAGGLYAIDTGTGQVEQTRYGSGGFVDDKMKERLLSLADLEDKGLVLNLGDAGSDLAVDESMFVDAWDMPILYYRANSYHVRMTTDRSGNAGIFRQEDNGIITGTENGIVDAVGIDFGAGAINEHLHSIGLADSPPPTELVEEILTKPDYEDTLARFILNESITARPTPVRKDAYLLISAGPDARYGTDDDMINWTRKTDEMLDTAPTNPAQRTGRKNLRARRGAFTLIELLVVIGIIAVLFGSIFAASRSLIARAKNRETQSLLTVVQQAIEEFKREQTANPTISRSKAYQTRFDRYPPDELEFFVRGATNPGKRGDRSLAPGGATVMPEGPYDSMKFYTEGLPPEEAAKEHRDLAAMIIAIETLGDASSAILGQIAEKSRVPGPVDGSGNPALYLDRNANGNWDPESDEAIRYIVDTWGVPLGYLSQRDFVEGQESATRSSNHEGWNEASTEIIRMNGGQPVIFSYGANGEAQLKPDVMTREGVASLAGDFEDGSHSVDHPLNADNVYLNETLTDKLSQGIVE